MAKVQKVTIGIRPQQKMFRIRSCAGTVIDSLLALREAGELPDSYFSEVAFINNDEGILLRSESNVGVSIKVSHQDIVYTEDYFHRSDAYRFDDTMKYFRVIWTCINSILKMTNVRRIGFVTEHRFAIAHPSAALMKSLINWEVTGTTDKFQLRFEERKDFTGKLEEGTSRYTNLITSIYDGRIDVDHAEPGFIYINLDAQQYYAPLISKNIPDEVVAIHNKLYKPAIQKLERRLDEIVDSHGKK